MFKRILVANDGSPGGYLALERAIEMTKKFKAELHMIVVEEYPLYGDMEATVMVLDQLHETYTNIVDKSTSMAKAKRIKLETHLLQGFAVSTVGEFTDTYKFDLLVCGWMKHCAFYRWLIGSDTDGLVNWVHCSVLVVK